MGGRVEQQEQEEQEMEQESGPGAGSGRGRMLTRGVNALHMWFPRGCAILGGRRARCSRSRRRRRRARWRVEQPAHTLYPVTFNMMQKITKKIMVKLDVASSRIFLIRIHINR